MTGLSGCVPCARCGCCGWVIEEHDEVSSTNELMKRAIEQGAPEGQVICARTQTGGYGRQGRAWSSPEGGLYMSVLLRPAVPPAQTPTLSLVVGLAVQRAIAQITGASNIKVKWPNDVVLEPEALREPLLMLPDQHERSDKPFQKLCGISLEQHAGGICVGIGVNVERPQGAAPVNGKNAAAYVAELGSPADAATVRDAILRQLEELYPVWAAAGFAPFTAAYDEVAALAGVAVKVELADGSLLVAGEAIGVYEQGRLLVRTDDGVVPITSGEAHVIL